MSPRFRLSEVHDVSNVAIITLGERGYRVWWEASERPSADDWWAEKEGREFVAKSPLGLLGLVTLWESRGDEWQKRPGEPDLVGRLKAEALAPFRRERGAFLQRALHDGDGALCRLPPQATAGGRT